MSIWAFVALLCLAPDAFADTKIYCDNKCGTHGRANSSAVTSPQDRFPEWTALPTSVVQAAAAARIPKASRSGPEAAWRYQAICWSRLPARSKRRFVASQLVDASQIAIAADFKAKTMTLDGTVPSAAQRSTAAVIVRNYARGYKILNHLTVAPKNE